MRLSRVGVWLSLAGLLTAVGCKVGGMFWTFNGVVAANGQPQARDLANGITLVLVGQATGMVLMGIGLTITVVSLVRSYVRKDRTVATYSAEDSQP